MKMSGRTKTTCCVKRRATLVLRSARAELVVPTSSSYMALAL
jgi:hypothetical protein